MIGTNQVGMLDSFASLGNFVFTNNLPIGQSGVINHYLSMGSSSSFDAGANAITLNNVSNIFLGAVSLTGSDVKLTTLQRPG